MGRCRDEAAVPRPERTRHAQSCRRWCGRSRCARSIRPTRVASSPLQYVPRGMRERWRTGRADTIRRHVPRSAGAQRAHGGALARAGRRDASRRCCGDGGNDAFEHSSLRARRSIRAGAAGAPGHTARSIQAATTVPARFLVAPATRDDRARQAGKPRVARRESVDDIRNTRRITTSLAAGEILTRPRSTRCLAELEARGRDNDDGRPNQGVPRGGIPSGAAAATATVRYPTRCIQRRVRVRP